MNTTEHLVEVYYRKNGCFTASDIKILNGNNRQIDLLAFHLKSGKYFHIEVNVSHSENWNTTLSGIEEKIQFKFFGATRDLRPENKNTDHSKNKNYLNEIKRTYESFGIDYHKLIRVWCTWNVKENEDQVNSWKIGLAKKNELREENFELLSFRDSVLPQLLNTVGTAYYEDELLRTLSIIKEFNKQTINKN